MSLYSVLCIAIALFSTGTLATVSLTPASSVTMPPISDCSLATTTATPPTISGLAPSPATAYTYCTCANNLVASLSTTSHFTAVYTVCAAAPYPTIASQTVDVGTWDKLLGAIQSAAVLATSGYNGTTTSSGGLPTPFPYGSTGVVTETLTSSNMTHTLASTGFTGVSTNGALTGLETTTPATASGSPTKTALGGAVPTLASRASLLALVGLGGAMAVLG